jgi:tRNA 2-thiouridine synthesizing protein A
MTLTTSTPTATTVDARGLACPMSIVKAAQWARSAAPGELMDLLATDAGSLKDVPAWCRSTGNDLVERRADAGVQHFLIRRAWPT